MKRLIGILLLTLFTTVAFSQELRLVVYDQPLNKVLNGLSIEISFDDEALSQHFVTVNRAFKTPMEAIQHLLIDKPFVVELIGNVYVIYKKRETQVYNIPIESKSYFITGIVTDEMSGERLPYTYLSTKRGTVESDEFGVFIIKQDSETVQQISVQYLGYEALDTTLSVGTHQLSLSPQSIFMDEVVINSSPASLLLQTGKTSGEVRINQQIAQYIPGSIDNSVFNLLRMMPGVRASGEPSDDLIVWGSNAGESQINYDGYTLFGLKNFNDHISLVNPYMVKDIRLQKGGYNASLGNRIGAIAEITGIDGSTQPTVKANISNQTANVYLSSPINKYLRVSAAYRQTFYNLYKKDKLESWETDTVLNFTEMYIKPKYNFGDLNVKFSGKTQNNDSYYLSLYGADDRFKYSVIQNNTNGFDAAEKNKQYGAASAYNRLWDNGSVSKVLVAYSQFASSVGNLTNIIDPDTSYLNIVNTKNSIAELSAKINHSFTIGHRQQLEVGVEWKQYQSKLNKRHKHLNTASVYLTDNILLGKLSLEPGIRADVVWGKKTYFLPHLSARYQFNNRFNATASWGMYRQYLTRTPYQYESGSHQLVWNVNDSTFMSAMHSVVGAAYSHSGFLVSIEAYLKQTRNGLYNVDNNVYVANNTIWGANIYASKEILGKNTLFASYSLTRSKEPQNKLGQELKVGGVANLHPFYLSFTYIYGTGFPFLSTGGHGHKDEEEEESHENEGESHSHSGETKSNQAYNRLDIAATYSVQVKKCKLQMGVSLLNVFDSRNIKYNYQITSSNSVRNIYTKATPFTPMLFVEIKF